MSSTTTDTWAQVRATIRSHPALQQPEWPEPERLREAVAHLETAVPLTRESRVRELRRQLAEAGRGEAVVLQAGDCAEPITDTGVAVVERKAQSLETMANVLSRRAGVPAVRIGRIAGQYAKPRSNSHEVVDGQELTTFRGSLVNGPAPTPSSRTPDPGRLVQAHRAAQTVAAHLSIRPGRRVWTSHEALVLDYELPQLRPTLDDQLVLGSADTVWIGARTNHPDGAHARLMGSILNPVGCKVSPQTTPHELVRLAEVLNPRREAGKLMLVARMGAAIHQLPDLMAVMRREGQPALWLCDPMHANTRVGPDGRKTRYLDAIERELREFGAAAKAIGVPTAGIHLETTVDVVRECLVQEGDHREASDPYTTLCDPRLTIQQALDLLSGWPAGGAA